MIALTFLTAMVTRTPCRCSSDGRISLDSRWLLPGLNVPLMLTGHGRTINIQDPGDDSPWQGRGELEELAWWDCH